MIMKKFFFFAAIAAIGLASCSNDETIASQATSESNAIGFRAFVKNVTRGIDANLASTGFRVTATKTNDASTVYFTNVDFTGSTTFTSETKYYWPSGYNLDFYAYAPISAEYVGEGKQIVPTSDGSAYSAAAYNKFIVTPATTAASQIDLVYARTNNWGKATGAATNHSIPTDADGVTINFRHAESKVLIKLYNSNSNIKVVVRDASICNINNTGVFTFADTNTDGQNTGSGTTLSSSTWSSSGSGSYSQTDESETKFNVASGSAAQVGQDWILIPQSLTYATTYDNTQSAPYPFTGACIKVNLKILNNATGGDASYIVGSATGENGGYVTALWPLKSTPTAWEMGKRYTYTVDLAGGGYYEGNNTGDAGLDPILSGAEIKFVSVTVDDWTEETGNVYTGSTPSTPVAP